MNDIEKHLVQGSDEWKEWRKTKIGASDAPIILGVSPFMRPYDLWLIKTGKKDEPVITPMMQRGIDLEAEARKKVEEYLGVTLFPDVIESTEKPWAIASLDGISYDGKTIVEIKCPSTEVHLNAIINEEIPLHYMIQCQYQLWVTNSLKMYYFSYSPETDILIKVTRNEEMINKIIDKCEEFYECMRTDTAPDIDEKDYVYLDTHEFKLSQINYMEKKNKLEEAKKEYEISKQRLLDFTDDGNCQGAFVRITRTCRIGTINYKKAMKEWGKTAEEAEEFRNPSSFYAVITIKK